MYFCLATSDRSPFHISTSICIMADRASNMVASHHVVLPATSEEENLWLLPPKVWRGSASYAFTPGTWWTLEYYDPAVGLDLPSNVRVQPLLGKRSLSEVTLNTESCAHEIRAALTGSFQLSSDLPHIHLDSALHQSTSPSILHPWQTYYPAAYRGEDTRGNHTSPVNTQSYQSSSSGSPLATQDTVEGLNSW